MGIVSVQQCRTSGDFAPLEVPSHSTPGVTYTVIVQGDDPADAICECEGFQFRGQCAHQAEAVGLKCNWTQLSGPEEQTHEHRVNKICPRCMGETEWVMELDDQ